MKILNLIGVPFRFILAILFITLLSMSAVIILPINAVVALDELKDTINEVGELMIDTVFWVYKPL
jgi:hypothetical protein